MLAGFHTYEHIVAERAAEYVRGLGRASLTRRYQPHAELLIRDGMVSGERNGITLADKITARIADVGDDGTIVAQGAGDDGGGH